MIASRSKVERLRPCAPAVGGARAVTSCPIRRVSTWRNTDLSPAMLPKMSRLTQQLKRPRCFAAFHSEAQLSASDYVWGRPCRP
jgi:hypothetical protein